MVLYARDLTVSYPGAERPALAGVDFTIARGEVVAVTGPSGCGKSTLMHVLAGVLVPETGVVKLHGKNLSSASADVRARVRRHEIGMIFQDGRLVPELPAVEDVMLPLLVGGVPRSVARQRALAALTSVGVAELAHRRSARMSGGQAQRVAIARALVHEPAIVLADEPTGALDTENSQSVMDLLVSSVRARGGALVIVTHDERVAAIADRRLPMLDGRLATAFASAL